MDRPLHKQEATSTPEIRASCTGDAVARETATAAPENARARAEGEDLASESDADCEAARADEHACTATPKD